jgi:hypothetical protein
MLSVMYVVSAMIPITFGVAGYALCPATVTSRTPASRLIIQCNGIDHFACQKS